MQHTEEGDFGIYKAVYIGLHEKVGGNAPPFLKKWGRGVTAPPAPLFPTPLLQEK